MPGKMLTKFRNRLLRRRREILEQVSHTESDLKALEYRDIEIVDEAQREGLIRMLNLLDERGRAEIKEINDALDRITAGTYGTCELCRGQITLRRLSVMPATRLCRKCIQKYEKAQEIQQRHRNEIINAEHLEAFQNLDDDKLSLRVFKLPFNRKII